MKDIIHVLPEHVANQIAAGEVIQRPASVVKELIENSIDAGATCIDVRIKDAGRTLIEVQDNGKGMSPMDARRAFDRHATSKLLTADDLFQLRTMGFRGEALASIASVAQVELMTRRSMDEVGWKIELNGGVLEVNEPTLCAQGARFCVRNLFFNIPARRKFLSDNAKEFRLIREVFIQIALVYPEIEFRLVHNDDFVYQLPKANTKQRILFLFGKRAGGQLVKMLYPVEVNTQLVRVSGFVGDPASAGQRDPLQYFFVNGRYIQHKYFRSALLKAYESLIPQGSQPAYFLYFEVDPASLDVNIHPTKTEVKFEQEQAIWPILHAMVREALGKFHAVPSIDFDTADAPDIQVYTGERRVDPPKVQFDPTYNPFVQKTSSATRDWEKLMVDFHSDSEDSDVEGPSFFASESSDYDVKPTSEASLMLGLNCFQLFQRYLVLHDSDRFYLVHQRRAHISVLYHTFLSQLQRGHSLSQTLLFPLELIMDEEQRLDFNDMMPRLNALGFQFEKSGLRQWVVTAVPDSSKSIPANELVAELLAVLKESMNEPLEERDRKMAMKLAQAAAIKETQRMHDEEQNALMKAYVELGAPRILPDGQRICCLCDETVFSELF